MSPNFVGGGPHATFKIEFGFTFTFLKLSNDGIGLEGGVGDVIFKMLRFCSQLRLVRLSSRFDPPLLQVSIGYLAIQFWRSLTAKWSRVSTGILPAACCLSMLYACGNFVLLVGG